MYLNFIDIYQELFLKFLSDYRAENIQASESLNKQLAIKRLQQEAEKISVEKLDTKEKINDWFKDETQDY